MDVADAHLGSGLGSGGFDRSAPSVSQGTEQPPGVNAAATLFDRGLWFEAVVRNLRNELGFSTEQATNAAGAAAALRMKQT